MTFFNLPYHISNNGDGSASVHFHSSLKKAKKADSKEMESGEGFAEETAGTVTLKVENGELYFEDYDDVDGKWQKIWVKVVA